MSPRRRVLRREQATRFDLVRPCACCPFRTDRPGFLTEARAREIADALVHHDHRFACHNALAQHCAGALLLLDALGQPNLNPRLAVACGLLDLARLDRTAPTFTDADAFVAHHAQRTPPALPLSRRTNTDR